MPGIGVNRGSHDLSWFVVKGVVFRKPFDDNSALYAIRFVLSIVFEFSVKHRLRSVLRSAFFVSSPLSCLSALHTVETYNLRTHERRSVLRPGARALKHAHERAASSSGPVGPVFCLLDGTVNTPTRRHTPPLACPGPKQDQCASRQIKDFL